MTLDRRPSRTRPTARLGALAGAFAAALAFAGPALSPTVAVAKDWEELQAALEDDALVVHLGMAQTYELPRGAADVIVSDPAIVEVTLRTASQSVLYGMRIGQTNILFFDEHSGEIEDLSIRVEHDVSVLRAMIAQQFPDAQVSVQSVLGEIVLTGTVRSSVEAGSIQSMTERFVAAVRASQSESGDVLAVDPDAPGVVNRIAVLNEEQVLLQVRVAEVNRNVLKRLGVDWNAGLQATTITSQVGFGAGSAGPLTGSLSFTGALFNFLEALEQHSLVRTLAEPSLTAVSGESASFLAGGEFPIPVATQDNTVTIEFKSFGVGLDFTPVVLGDGRISLQIATEVSELSDNNSITLNNITIPGLTVRRADTTLEVSSGGTIMMAGLIQQTTRRLSQGLPGMRSLPVLGAFFRAEEAEIDQTELVILVTPILVQQASADEFSLPTDGFAPASDLDMYLYGRMHAVYGATEIDAEEARAAAALEAPFGFIME